MTRAMGAWRKWNIDAGRHAIESSFPPADYLRMSYYEKWLRAARRAARQAAAWSRARRSKAASRRQGSPKATPPLTAAKVPPRWSQRQRRRAAMSPVAPTLPGGPARARPQHQSDRPHAPAALRARQARHRSIAITASSSSPTPTPISSARSRSTSTRCASPRASCGASRPRRTTAVYIDLWDDYLEPA